MVRDGKLFMLYRYFSCLHIILMIDFKLLADCGVHVSFISILSFHSANEIGFLLSSMMSALKTVTKLLKGEEN